MMEDVMVDIELLCLGGHVQGLRLCSDIARRPVI